MSGLSVHGTWSTKFGFITAAVGAAVGLGNIWKFPYMAGTNGGGAFVLVYIGCALAIAIPILIAEILIGRATRESPPRATARLAREEGHSGAWSIVGWLGTLSGYLILSFYSVIAGWALAYVFESARGAFAGFSGADASRAFDALLEDPLRMTFWHSAFMLMTVAIVARGINSGIEAAVKVLMPALFAMLVVMVAYSAATGDFARAVEFLFAPDFGRLDGEVLLMAIGQAFFSIGVSMGIMMAYGAYLPAHVGIGQSAFVIAAADTLVALLAGLAIFPLVFAGGLDPAEGPGLTFVTLPIAFGHMPAGALFGSMFFLLLVFGALTSAIAVLEPMVAWLAEGPGLTRSRAAWGAGAVAWGLGIASVLSFNRLADFRPITGRTLYELIDYLTANLMMPIGGLLIAVLVGWFVSRKRTLAILEVDDVPLVRLWFWLLRYPVPIAILAIFIANLG